MKDKKKLQELTKEKIMEGRECAGFNLKMATRAVQNFFDNAYRSVGLEGTQYTMLSHVYVVGPIALSKLADLMYVDRTTLGRNLKPLEKRELIKINTGDDKREKIISITDQGKEILSEALPVWRDTHQQIKDIVGLENWESMLSNLRTLTTVLRER